MNPEEAEAEAPANEPEASQVDVKDNTDSKEGGEVSAVKKEEDRQAEDEIEEAPIDDATVPDKEDSPIAEKI